MDRYLTPADYSIQIRNEIKTLIGGADEKKLVIAESAAVSQMKSYLKKLYDISQIFFLIKGAHDPAIAYTAGSLVYYKESTEKDESYLVYEAIADVPASAWDITKWNLFTKRNPFVIMYAVDITLYHIHSKDATRLIPEVREKRYNVALDWLELVGAGKIDADLPQIPDTSDAYSSDIRYNSHEAENQRW
jgi:hypothetical protein